jgi:hypothetical protein
MLPALGIGAVAAAAVPDARHLHRLRLVTRSLRQTPVVVAGRLVAVDPGRGTAVIAESGQRRMVRVRQVAAPLVAGDPVELTDDGTLWPQRRPAADGCPG